MSRGPAIRVIGLSKRFADGTEAVKDISFEVAAGSILALLGRNGSGKTTTVRILTGLTAATTGTVEVLGLDVGTDAREVQAQIGVTLQESSLDDVLTARQLLRFVASLVGLSRTEGRRRAAELLDSFGLSANGDRPIGTCSGGTKRRIDLAVSLVRPPRILFLDEPTTGLDPQSRRALWDTIFDLRARGTTVFLTTQYIEEADVLADRIAVIDRGSLVEVSSPEALRARHGRARLELTIADEQVEVATNVLAGGGRRHRPGGPIVVPVEAADDAIEVLGSLRARGITVRDFEIRRDSLEDVFLRLTGDGAGPVPAAATAAAP